ncbi:MAG: hypothetical protein IKE42_28415 [Aquamicrobium sp.]|nr:hypothetical protein [Aquamicrobium sp.]
MGEKRRLLRYRDITPSEAVPAKVLGRPSTPIVLVDSPEAEEREVSASVLEGIRRREEMRRRKKVMRWSETGR